MDRTIGLAAQGSQNRVMFVVDLTDAAICALRNTKLYVDIATGMRDVKVDAWLSELTARWGHPLHHSKLDGVTSFS